MVHTEDLGWGGEALTGATRSLRAKTALSRSSQTWPCPQIYTASFGPSGVTWSVSGIQVLPSPCKLVVPVSRIPMALGGCLSLFKKRPAAVMGGSPIQPSTQALNLRDL